MVFVYVLKKEIFHLFVYLTSFDVQIFLVRLFSEKCHEKALRAVIGLSWSVIGIRQVIGTLVASEDGQRRLIAFFKDEFDLNTNSDLFISTSQHGTTTHAVFQQGLQNFKSQVYMSYFSDHKPIVTCVSF